MYTTYDDIYNFIVDLNKEAEQDKTEISTGIITWDSKPQLSSDVDWGAPATDFRVKTDDFDLKWSDDENDKDSDDSDGGISMNIGAKKDEDVEKDEEEAQQIDIMAQQLKFVACLKILMEELSTLATGFEVDGKQIFSWEELLQPHCIMMSMTKTFEPL